MPPVERETIATFLSNGTAMMKTDETRSRCRDLEVLRPGQLLISLQVAEWDPLGVDQTVGCKALDEIETHFPGDTELISARQEFVHTAQRTYLQALEDRKPETLESKAKMPKEKIIEFFDACNTKMGLPETREVLLKHLTETSQIPNQLIIDMQKDMLEVLGFEREHGCRVLSSIGQDFKDDMELLRRFQHWSMCAQTTCTQVMAMYKESGGKLPENFMNHFHGNPELQELWKRANEEVSAMSPKERGELLMGNQKKVEVFMQLPAEARQRHMERLSDEEKIDLMKTHVLALSVMRQQWQQHGGHAPNCPQHGHGHGHEHEAGGTSAAPSQQQMM